MLSSSFGSKIILVVDDEPAIAETLRLVLNHSNQNFFAIATTDVHEALSMVHGIQPDLVLLDVMMPGTTGLQHAIEMREHCGCSVLLMSGQTTTQAVIEESLEAGNTPFEIVAKPIHPTDLIKKIHEMLQGSAAEPRWKNPLRFHVQ
jgi:DNA-binding response OmpR family regulator